MDSDKQVVNEIILQRFMKALEEQAVKDAQSMIHLLNQVVSEDPHYKKCQYIY